MTERFEKMTKVPKEPAAKVLSEANVRLDTKLDAPASAPHEVVLAELDEKGAIVDLMRVLSVLLPPRERVWWACLAARDFVGEGPEKATASLKAAEAWVFQPVEANVEAARAALDHAPIGDKTINCAEAVLYADGTLGPGDLAQYPAPAGLAEMMAFGVVITALGEHEGDPNGYAALLVDRAVDIGRGGNGRVEAPEPKSEEA